MENKIRVQNKDVYVIEVNDKGDTIEFDLTDVEFPFRLLKAKEDAERIANDLDLSSAEDGIERAEILREYFKKMRSVVDNICGEGASDKIFGNHNYLNMFNDFIEQLMPHIDAMKVLGESIKDNIIKKYGNEEDVL